MEKTVRQVKRISRIMRSRCRRFGKRYNKWPQEVKIWELIDEFSYQEILSFIDSPDGQDVFSLNSPGTRRNLKQFLKKRQA